MSRKWISTVVYATEGFGGAVDVDYAYDKHAELDDYLRRGPPMRTIREINTRPMPAPIEHNETIEGWMRKLHQLAGLKDCETGTKEVNERSISVDQEETRNHANENADSPRNRNPDLDPLLGAK